MTAPRGRAERARETVTAEALTRFSTDVFSRAGLERSDAAIVAEVLVWANLRGIDTHGVLRIPRYVELIESGDMNPRPAIRIRTETPAAVLVEADRAAGPVAMMRGVAEAVRKARDAGVGLALVRATTHTAALGYYTLKIAGEGMAGIALAGSWPNVIYHGARAAGVSTSPISIAVPGGAPVVLDMATSLVSMGKLNQAKKAGKPIPEGWALDAKGNPTTDPEAAQTPLPMGGAKGSGLSFMVECLASLITSNPLLAESLEGTPAGARHRQNGFVMAIDLAPFGDLAHFRHEVDRLVKVLKALPRAGSTEEILVPGERGARTLRERSREGIPLPPAVREELRALAEKLGVAMFSSSR
ncbi:MAG TPA: Ldh family oxidoreductase [Burkholderiales bacterium]|nr:Ldh family oxidoreductase [Burkholderiales bacterium]